MQTVFTTTYQKYGLQHITVTIVADAVGGHCITRKTEIPSHPHNNREETYTFKLSLDGVPRWVTNNVVPPADSIKELFIDQVPGYNPELTLRRRDEDTTASINAYRKRMENHVPSEEEMFEMRANFKPGSVVVNVVTGKRTQL